MDVAVIVVLGHLYSFILFCLFLLRRSFWGAAKTGTCDAGRQSFRWRQGAVKGGGRNRFDDYKRVSKCGELDCVFSVVK